MMFGPAHSRYSGRIALTAILSLVLATSCAAAGEFGAAIVPITIIYPGQQIEGAQVKAVDVTNPNLIEGYARKVSDVEGMVTTKTLLPGRTIMISALRQAYTRQARRQGGAGL
jgi:flagella basal body P-ring formation protein FlgA